MSRPELVSLLVGLSACLGTEVKLVPEPEGRAAGWDAGVAPWEAPGAWEPGADIPGWEDYPCEDELVLPPDAEVRDIVASYGQIRAAHWIEGAEPDEEMAEHPGYIRMDGDDTDGCVDGDNCYVWMQAWSEAWRTLEPRAQGWYELQDAPFSGARDIGGGGNTAEGTFVYMAQWGGQQRTAPASGRACFSRIRPDQFRGLWIAEIDPYFMPDYWSGPRVVVYRFDVRFEHHAAFTVDELSNQVFPVYHVYYDSVPYEDAWPWDDITDPAVRQALFRDYTPLR